MADVGFKKVATAETDYGTGAHRDSREGKGGLHFLPWDAVFCVSRIYEIGNKGRSPTGDGNDRNWEHGMPILDFCQSAMNHLTAYIAGDRSEPHLSQAGWNVMCAIQTSIWVYLGFRPKSLNRLPNHRANWQPGDESPCPLSPQEIAWLTFRGVIKKEEQVTIEYKGK